MLGQSLVSIKLSILQTLAAGDVDGDDEDDGLVEVCRAKALGRSI